MNQQIAVDIDVLAQDAMVIGDKIAGAQKNVNRIQVILDELNGTWEGIAKDNFLSMLSKDKEKLSELTEEADNLAKKMKEAVELYKRCEIEVSNQIDSMNV